MGPARSRGVPGPSFAAEADPRQTRPRLPRGVLLPLLLLAAASCAEERQAHLVASAKVPAYVDAAVEKPHVRFDDEQVSLNDRCPVRKAKLNLRMPPVYVNGKPIGFC